MRQDHLQPRGWLVARMPDIADINPPGFARDPVDNEHISFVPMQAVEAMTGHLDLSQRRPWCDVRKGYTRFQDGDVLFAKITPCMENGKVTVAKNLVGGLGAGSTEFHVIRPSATVLPDYVRLFLLQESFRREARARMTGTAGQLRVPTAFLEETLIPLPPLGEQHRLIEAIDTYFARLDEAEATLARVKRNLNRYRASVLQAAVDGHLLGQRARPNVTGIRVLPEGWHWTNLAELKEFSLYGPRFSSDAYSDDGVFIVRTSDVSEGGRIDLTRAPRIRLSMGDYEKFRLVRGDLLVTRTGSIGTVALYDDSVRAIPGAFLIQYRLSAPLITAKYCLFFLESPQAQARLKTGAAGVGRPNLNAPTIESIPIPLPPPNEQAAIVAEVERQLSILRNAKSDFESISRRLLALRQAVLRHAFEGKIVDQDPRDEPASILLHRIRAERAKAASTPEALRRRGRPHKAVKK
jgi:type I restriction enzyme, S subunit